MGQLTYEEFQTLEQRFAAGQASKEDLAALEPYRAKRAVLVASGFGSRMLPLTINTPKPLIRVKGRRIIETILDALKAIDVTEVYVVVGYLADEFELLKKDYPNITLIKNDEFATTNNISSAVRAKDFFANAYVFESDLFLKNPHVLKKYSYESFYLGVPVESTPDWCFDTDGEGYITDLHKGGTNCHHMYGVSFWTKEDGQKLRDDLPTAFEDEANKQRFWDDVPCVLKGKDYHIRVVPCSFDDIDEIDSLAELQQIDPAYVIS